MIALSVKDGGETPICSQIANRGARLTIDTRVAPVWPDDRRPRAAPDKDARNPSDLIDRPGCHCFFDGQPFEVATVSRVGATDACRRFEVAGRVEVAGKNDDVILLRVDFEIDVVGFDDRVGAERSAVPPVEGQPRDRAADVPRIDAVVLFADERAVDAVHRGVIGEFQRHAVTAFRDQRRVEHDAVGRIAEPRRAGARQRPKSDIHFTAVIVIAAELIGSLK